MGRITLLFTILGLSAALPLVAQPQQQSLGDLARELRAQHEKNDKKATKVFTNENLPTPKPGEAVSSPPAPEGNPSTTGPTASKPSEETGSKPPQSRDDKKETRDYWQGKFKAARQAVAQAKEQQHLSEDELNLLQIQQLRENGTSLNNDLATKVQDKQSQVDVNKATTAAAQKDLDDLEKEFQDSGAPSDWSQTN